MESIALTLWRAGPPQLKRQPLGARPMKKWHKAALVFVAVGAAVWICTDTMGARAVCATVLPHYKDMVTGSGRMPARDASAEPGDAIDGPAYWSRCSAVAPFVVSVEAGYRVQGFGGAFKKTWHVWAPGLNREVHVVSQSEE